jgi:hypothetical protein
MRSDPAFWSEVLRARVNKDGIVDGETVMRIIRAFANERELLVFDEIKGPDAVDVVTAEMRVALYMWKAVRQLIPNSLQPWIAPLKKFCDDNAVCIIWDGPSFVVRTMLTGKIKRRPK